MHFISQLCARAQARKRTNAAVLAHSGLFQHAVAKHLRVIIDSHITQHAAGADADAIAQRHATLEHHVHIDEHVAAQQQLAALIKTRRIGQACTGAHCSLGALASIHTLQLCQLHAVIDAQHFALGGSHQRRHHMAIFDSHADDIGQVILTLGIVGTQLTQVAAQHAGRQRQHTGVAFAHSQLCGRGVFLFDDGAYAPAVIAQDAAITSGVVQHDRQQGQLARPGQRQQRTQRVGLHQRHIAIQHQHGVIIRHLRQGLSHRMSGTLLLGLQGPAQRFMLHRSLHLGTAVAMHHHQSSGLQLAGGVDDVLKQRFAGQRLQDLGQV